ncbi:MAG: hypothetical protein RJA70_4197, partial [Pseudomonadota bacterium]
MKKYPRTLLVSCLLATSCGEGTGPKTSSSSNWLVCSKDADCSQVEGTCDLAEKVCVDADGNKIDARRPKPKPEVKEPPLPEADGGSSEAVGAQPGAQADASTGSTDAGCLASAPGCGGQGDAGGVCLLPLETGPCKAYFEVFGFDAVTGQCEPFVYGGC